MLLYGSDILACLMSYGVACILNLTKSKGLEKLMAIPEEIARVQLSIRAIYFMERMKDRSKLNGITFITIYFD